MATNIDGIQHKSVGTELTQSEWEATDSHSLASGASFPGTPSEGELFYRTDEHKWYVYNGTSWLDLSLEVGVDVLAEQTIGIANDNLVETDDAAISTGDYAKFTANGLEGKTTTELTGDLDAATTSAQGAVELATAAETTTGTDTGRAVTPDGLAGSDFGTRVVELIVIAHDTALTTGDGKMHFFIPSQFDGMNLVDADACVVTASSSGTPTVQIYNVTDSVDMLSTAITCDASEKTSFTASTPPVIDTSNDDVVVGDELRVDVDVAGTDTTGLVAILAFALP